MLAETQQTQVADLKRAHQVQLDELKQSQIALSQAIKEVKATQRKISVTFAGLHTSTNAVDRRLDVVEQGCVINSKTLDNVEPSLAAERAKIAGLRDGLDTVLEQHK